MISFSVTRFGRLSQKTKPDDIIGKSVCGGVPVLSLTGALLAEGSDSTRRIRSSV